MVFRFRLKLSDPLASDVVVVVVVLSNFSGGS